jgi:coenzyme F420-reducing hydrogenase gamma subunit
MDMEQKEELGRSLWVELLGLYDEYMQLGKTDERTIELLEKAGLLRAGTVMGKEIMDAFPQLDFKTVEGLVRQGIRERIVGEIRKAPF